MTPVKRTYDSGRRRAQAAATHRDVIDAAGTLFAQHGYTATTIDAIAARAGVSRETIFKSIGSKRRLLQLWVEQQVAGPDESVPIAQQRWIHDISDADDRGRRAAIAAAALSEIHARAIDALVTLRAAAYADPEIAELWQVACEQRRDDAAAVTAALTAIEPDPHDRPSHDVVDVVYALSSPELFEVLVRQCGWTTERFRDWLASGLATLILDDPTPHKQRPTD